MVFNNPVDELRKLRAAGATHAEMQQRLPEIIEKALPNAYMDDPEVSIDERMLYLSQRAKALRDISQFLSEC